VSLPLKVERAFARYLTSVAPFLIGKGGSYVLTDTGLRIKLTSGDQFDFPVLPGQSICEVSAPAIVAACLSATQDITSMYTLNHRCSVEVTLFFPADADPGGLGTPQELLDCFEFAAKGLVENLYCDDLDTLLKQYEPDLTILHCTGPRTQRSGWIQEQRTRVFVVAFDVIATPAVL